MKEPQEKIKRSPKERKSRKIIAEMIGIRFLEKLRLEGVEELTKEQKLRLKLLEKELIVLVKERDLMLKEDLDVIDRCFYIYAAEIERRRAEEDVPDLNYEILFLNYR